MFIYHFRLRKRILAAAAAIIGLVLALVICLPGCQSNDAPIMVETEEQQLAFLTSLGWTVKATPVETLDLQLPQQWDGEWTAYVTLQNDQGLPFADFAGKKVRRCTYALTNYPGIENGVQANLYICEGQLIGGDVISLGKAGFQTGLTFPAHEKT